MKRILLSVAVAATILSACTSPAKKAEDQAEDFRTRIEKCSDPDSLRIYVEQAVAYAQTLADKGKVDEAQMYLNDIQSAIARKDPAMIPYFDRAKAPIDSLPVAKANAVADSILSAKDSIKNAASDKAAELKEKAGNAADKAVDKAKEKAADAADKAKSAVNNALN